MPQIPKQMAPRMPQKPKIPKAKAPKQGTFIWVADTATLKCDYGTAPSVFKVEPSATFTQSEGKWLATILQYIVGKNVQPFGNCKAQPFLPPCKPSIPNPWKPSVPTRLAGPMQAPALPFPGSTLGCTKGSPTCIKIIQPGQTKKKVDEAQGTGGKPNMPKMPKGPKGPKQQQNSQSNNQNSNPNSSLLNKHNSKVNLSKVPHPPDPSQHLKMFMIITFKGVSDTHAKGIVGNIDRESSFRPDVMGDNGTSGGLFQMHAERFDAMNNAVPDWRSNWQGQIDHALVTDRAPEYLNRNFGSSGEAAKWFEVNYERPAQWVRAQNSAGTYEQRLRNMGL